MYLLTKPAAGFFAERRESIEKTLRKAAEDRRRAEELSAEEVIARASGAIETVLRARLVLAALIALS